MNAALRGAFERDHRQIVKVRALARKIGHGARNLVNQRIGREVRVTSHPIGKPFRPKFFLTRIDRICHAIRVHQQQIAWLERDAIFLERDVGHNTQRDAVFLAQARARHVAHFLLPFLLETGAARPAAGLQPDEAPATALYSLEMVAELTGLTRREVLLCCRSGLVRSHPAAVEQPLQFDDAAVYALRRVAQARAVYGVNLAGAQLICELLDEVERLRAELDFWRGR